MGAVTTQGIDLSKALLSIQPLVSAIYFALAAIIALIAFMHSSGFCCFHEKYGWKRVDDVKWTQAIVFLLQIWDVYSDVFFTMSCERKWANNKQRPVDLFLFIGSLAFLLIPYLANLVTSLFFLSFFSKKTKQKIEGIFYHFQAFNAL